MCMPPHMMWMRRFGERRKAQVQEIRGTYYPRSKRIFRKRILRTYNTADLRCLFGFPMQRCAVWFALHISDKPVALVDVSLVRPCFNVFFSGVCHFSSEISLNENRSCSHGLPWDARRDISIHSSTHQMPPMMRSITGLGNMVRPWQMVSPILWAYMQYFEVRCVVSYLLVEGLTTSLAVGRLEFQCYIFVSAHPTELTFCTASLCVFTGIFHLYYGHRLIYHIGCMWPECTWGDITAYYHFSRKALTNYYQKSSVCSYNVFPLTTRWVVKYSSWPIITAARGQPKYAGE